MAIHDESNDVNWHAALDAYIEHGPKPECQQYDPAEIRKRLGDDLVSDMRRLAEIDGNYAGVIRCLWEAMEPQRRLEFWR